MTIVASWYKLLANLAKPIAEKTGTVWVKETHPHKPIVGTGFLTPIFYEDPTILPTPSFFKFCLPLPPTSTPHCSFCCLVSLSEWAIATHLMCYFLLNDIMDLLMLSLGTFVPQGPCSVLYATRGQFTEV